MHKRFVVISLNLLVSFMSPTLAANAGDANDCNPRNDPDRTIASCTRVIKAKGETASNRASAYRYRGLAYRAMGNLDRAIADYNEVINIDPKDAAAYYNRANAYYAKGDYDRAIADYSEAIRLDPKDAAAHFNRGNAYDDKGEYDRAIADFNEAIQLNPKGAAAYFHRGIGYLHRGSLAMAQADFKQASELAPKDAYMALWLDLAERRNNNPSRLAQAAAQLDMKVWPAPVVRLILGELTPTALLAAANNPSAITKRDQVCEAHFLQWRIGAGAGLERGGGAPLQTRGERLPDRFRRMIRGQCGTRGARLKALIWIAIDSHAV